MARDSGGPSRATVRAFKRRSVNPRINRRAAGPPAPRPKATPRPTRHSTVFTRGVKAPSFKPAQKRAERKVQRATEKGPGGKAHPLPRAHFYTVPDAARFGKGYIRLPGAKFYTSSLNEANTAATVTRPNRDVFQSIADKVILAPAVKALNISAKPYHAIAGASKAAVEGKDPGHGFLHPHGASFSDVLKSAGVKNKTVRGIAGFGLDVVADPTTYVTGGLGHVAAKGVAKGAEESATRKAIAVGARGRVPFTDVAGEKTLVKVPLRHAPKTAQKASGAVRNALHETVAPSATPTFRTPAEHQAIRGAERTARAEIQTGQRKLVRKVKALQDVQPNVEDRAAVRQAIEAGTAHKLPEPERTIARAYKREGSQAFKAKKARGLLDAPYRPQTLEDAVAFMPHVNQRALAEKGTAFAGGRRPAVEKGRTIRKTIEQANVESPDLFHPDPSVAMGVRGAQDVKNIALADMWQKVADLGKPLTKHSEIDHATEGVYRVTPHGLTELKAGEKADLKAIENAATGKTEGRFVVLNRQSVEHVRPPTRLQAKTAVGRAFDKAQGTIKLADTMYNPAFQPRNFVGDTNLAFQAGTGAKSMTQAVKGMEVMHVRNHLESSAEGVTGHGNLAVKAERALATPIDLAKSGRSTYGRELALAEKHGAINTGYVGSDVRSRLGGVAVEKRRPSLKGGKPHMVTKGVKGPGKVSAVNEYRENTPRFATYLEGRKRGMSPDKAAEHSLNSHIDYADLTPVERTTLRRVFPFYTFFARNTKIQAKNLVQHPGKAATIAKILDESAKAAGFSGGYNEWVGSLPDSQQKGLPVPVKVGDHVFPVFVSPPQSDLNQLTANPKEQLFNIANRLTFAKTVPELLANYSVFFRDKIQDPKKPRVPAPAGVEHLPGPIKDMLGVHKIVDPRHPSRQIWGWYSNADYAIRSLTAQTNLAVAGAKQSPDSRGIGGLVSVLTGLSGVRVAPDKSGANEINRLYKERDDLQNQLGAAQQESTKDRKGQYRVTAKTRRLKEQLKVTDHHIGQLRIKRGDAPEALPAGQRPTLTLEQRVQHEIENSTSDPGAKIRNEIENFQKGLP